MIRFLGHILQGRNCQMALAQAWAQAWAWAAGAKVLSSNYFPPASIHLREPHRWAYLCPRHRSQLWQLDQEVGPFEVQNLIDICLAVTASAHKTQSHSFLAGAWEQALA